MKIVNPDWNFQIVFAEGTVSQLIIEEPFAFRGCIMEFYRQLNFGEGRYVLSEDGKILGLERFLELIVDPLSINLDHKKILNGLYNKAELAVNTGDLYTRLCYLYAEIDRFIGEVEEELSCDLRWKREAELHKLFKLFEVSLDKEQMCLEEQLVSYIRAMNEFCGRKCFVFVNLKDFFSKQILEDMCREMFYQHVSVLLIESKEKYSLSNEKTWIIDKDLCEIF